MSQKTKDAYARDKAILALVGENCPADNVFTSLKEEYDAYKESLDEINCMIQYSQDMNDAEEVAYWRRFLMRTKMEMREIKERFENMMDANNTTKETVYS